ncbi:MAG: succinate dehydrogenase flavoprotein subunit [Planctomycetes bacterium]|nr:succinate dehydrogenase flavoprotein subunit [Planctomycetota bacterium]
MQMIECDVVIVGAGGAGLRAAVEVALLAPTLNCVVISKVRATRSHTGTAQGGIAAALGNEEPDNPIWHAFDTVKGGDWLGDQDAIEIMCNEAPQGIIDLEHMGMRFSRNSDGKISQRRFGGHTRDFGKAAVRRSCYSADRTGHEMMHTLYQQCLKHRIQFLEEYSVTELVVDLGTACGVIAYNIMDGAWAAIRAKAVLFATGGKCRMYQVTSNAQASTGDGMAIAAYAGIPLEDMEFVQFHPTGLLRVGILASEALRGEGGILRNQKGERFMERYAPTIKDLAPRDLISRCIYMEGREGRAFVADDGSYYVGLDLTHLPAEVFEKKIPEVCSFARTYLGIEPRQEPVPVQPTAHYAMGGIPTDAKCRVRADHRGNFIAGFFAAGECACASVHGANRLGTNALVELVVFGKLMGRNAVEYVKGAQPAPWPKEAGEFSRQEFARILEAKGGEKVGAIKKDLRRLMMDHVGVFRTDATVTRALESLKELRERMRKVAIQDRSPVYNTALMEAFELRHLIDLSIIIARGALERKETRGGHARDDFPNRDDQNWRKHTMAYWRGDGSVELAFLEVNKTIEERDPEHFAPKVRKY